MKTENNIEKLFEDEDLSVAPKAKELPLISLSPKPITDNIPNRSDTNKREFTRIDVSEKKLELKFSTGSQFARQYIENISLGGLFVKTEERPELGSIMPIEFSIPTDTEQKIFRLAGKVCRVTGHGVGLEFTNLSRSTQAELEHYVQSVLPKGVGIISKAKGSTIENLERLRSSKNESSSRQKKFLKSLCVILLLLGLNAYLLIETEQESFNSSTIKTQSMMIRGKNIPVANIRSFEKIGENKWLIRLSDKSSLDVTPRELEGQLPEYLVHTFQLLQSIQPVKPSRRTQNTRGIGDLK